MVDAPTERPNFAERVNFDELFAGIEGMNIHLSEAERERLRGIITRRASGFEGGDLMGDNPGLSIQKLVYAIIYALKNVGFSGLNLEGLGEWFGQQSGHNAAGTEQAMLHQATIAIYEDMKAAGGNLALAANAVSGQATGSEATVDVSWGAYRQIAAHRRELTPEQLERGSSLNGPAERFNVANATEVAPPSATPAAPVTPALTPAVPQV